MKNKSTAYNDRTDSRNAQLQFDESFAEKVIPENGLVRLLDEIAEEVESPLERALKRKGRKMQVSKKFVAQRKALLKLTRNLKSF